MDSHRVLIEQDGPRIRGDASYERCEPDGHTCSDCCWSWPCQKAQRLRFRMDPLHAWTGHRCLVVVPKGGGLTDSFLLASERLRRCDADDVTSLAESPPFATELGPLHLMEPTPFRRLSGELANHRHDGARFPLLALVLYPARDNPRLGSADHRRAWRLRRSAARLAFDVARPLAHSNRGAEGATLDRRDRPPCGATRLRGDDRYVWLDLELQTWLGQVARTPRTAGGRDNIYH